MDQAPCPLQASEGWRPEAWFVAVQRQELCQLSSWHGEAEQGVGMDPDLEERGDGELVWDELGEKEIQATAIQLCLAWIQKEEVTEDSSGTSGEITRHGMWYQLHLGRSSWPEVLQFKEEKKEEEQSWRTWLCLTCLCSFARECVAVRLCFNKAAVDNLLQGCHGVKM
jgi:hypothetical protein